jgi:hypothetical protein
MLRVGPCHAPPQPADHESCTAILRKQKEDDGLKPPSERLIVELTAHKSHLPFLRRFSEFHHGIPAPTTCQP